MAVPKRRKSKAKVRTRRSEWRKIKALPLVECPQCHQLKVPHRMCAECGFYKQSKVASADK
jgi:large subunit ribosomal protein L32